MQVTIEHAKKIGKELKAKGVVLIVFEKNGQFGVASYGDTREHCKALVPFVDRLTEEIGCGIDGPEF